MTPSVLNSFSRYEYPNLVSLSLLVMAISVMSPRSASFMSLLSPVLFSLSPLALSWMVYCGMG